MKLSNTVPVELKTTITPALEEEFEGLRPFEPVQKLELKIPDAERVVFDPKTQEPVGGQVEFTISMPVVGIIELPEWVEANVSSSFTQPWGYKSLKDKTQLDYQIEAEGDFSLEEGQSTESSLVQFTLTFKFACSLSGEGSAKFTADGLPAPSPAHGGA